METKNSIVNKALGTLLGLSLGLLIVSAIIENPAKPSADATNIIEAPKAEVTLAENQAVVVRVYRNGFLWKERTLIKYADGTMVQRDGKLGNPGDIVTSERGFFE